MPSPSDRALKHQQVALDLMERAVARLLKAKATIADLDTPESDRLRRAYTEAVAKLGHAKGAVWL